MHGNFRHGAAGSMLSNTGRMKPTPEYQAWVNMRRRCDPSRPASHRFAEYGAKGIRVCERWQGPSGFANFIEDMGSRPSPKHSLDRKESTGDYSPSNCRWAVPTVQTRNRAVCVVNELGAVLIRYLARRYRQASIARAFDIAPGVVLKIVHRTRWEDALEALATMQTSS